jgi:hypothetical protein
MLNGNDYNVVTDLLLFVGIFVVGTPALSGIMTGVHRLKARCCGKKQQDDKDLEIRMIEDYN